jgi:hypothetical protein
VIFPNVRASLGSRDVDLLTRLLARRTGRSRGYYEDQLAEQGFDSLLDHPDSLPAIMEGEGLRLVPAPLAFYVMVRHTLLESGLEDPRLADYLAALLVEFGEHGRAFRIAPHDDRTYDYLVDLVADIEEESSNRRQFLLRAHLGNYSLWLAGLFPDFVVARVHRRGAPGLDYYEGMGAEGYRLASECELAGRYDLTDLYRDFAGRFREVRRALNRISDRYFFPRTGAPVDRLLRQVVDRIQDN